MARLNRSAVLAPEAIDTVHVYNRVVRRCQLFGDDVVTGKNNDHRKLHSRMTPVGCTVSRSPRRAP